MSEESIKKATRKAVKWSSITEISAKIIAPVINMLLSRILAPEAFGILATITMIISFAEVFVESGFQKFLIQHMFKDHTEKHQYMSVAFWSNLFFSFVIWGILALFNEELAYLVGNEGLGHLIIITGVTIPLYGMIGIQNCELRKNLDFKKLFYVRIVAAFVPLFITLPLALLGLDYWSLIIGNIAGILVRAIMLIIVGKFKPLLFFNFKQLKHMLSFGVWTLMDGIAIWLTSWVDSLLISQYMTGHYLGLYKNATSTITALFAIVTSALTPVLFSALSKIQDDAEEFNKLFLSTQKTMCIFLLPLGIGMFLYQDFVTLILFGSNWMEASPIVGIMALTTALRTIFVSIYSEVYRAKGRFHLPLLLQIFDIFMLVPACIISVNAGFWPLVFTRAWIKLDLIIPEIICCWIVCKITPGMTWKNLRNPIFSTIVMTAFILFLQTVNHSILWQCLSIFMSIIVYFGILFLFERGNKMIRRILGFLKLNK